MANVTITASDVAPGANVKQVKGVAGTTITAGQALYLDTVTNTYKLASATTENTAAFRGIALCGASTGQPVVMAKTDADLDLGNQLSVGEVYVVSATAGAIAPVSDLVAGNFVSIVGISNASDSLSVTSDSGTQSTAAKA